MRNLIDRMALELNSLLAEKGEVTVKDLAKVIGVRYSKKHADEVLFKENKHEELD